MVKYRGKYRVVHEVDRLTFKPTNNPDDTFIYCAKGGQIWRQSPSTLVYERECKSSKYLFDKLTAADIKVIDFYYAEGLVRVWFDESDLDKVAKIVGARTLGANINPNSKRNLKLLGLA